jgi:uncharacterized membrane protein YozB (DUF420 family)
VKVKLYTSHFSLSSWLFMAFFDAVFVVATVSLAVQLAVLFLLFYGYWLRRKLKFRQHGVVMATAVFVHLGAVFFIMIPSFALSVLPQYVLRVPLGLVSVVSVFHGVAGAVALVLGMWFVLSWRFRRDLRGCSSKRKIMRAALVVWVVALVLGSVLYAIFNWAILAG